MRRVTRLLSITFSLGLCCACAHQEVQPAYQEAYSVAYEATLKEQWQQALVNAHKAHNLAQDIGTVKHKAKSNHLLGYIYSASAEYGQSLVYYTQAYTNYKKLNELNWQAQVLNNIGAIYYRAKLYRKGLQYFQKAYQISQQVELAPETAASIFDNLGNSYLKLGQCSKAMGYHQLALSLPLNNTRKAASLDRLSLTEMECGEPIGALRQSQQAIALISDEEMPTALGTYFINAGTISYHINDVERAAQYFELAITTLQHTNNAYELCLAAYNRAGIYNEANQPRMALELLGQALAHPSLIHPDHRYSDALSLAKNLAITLKETELALKWSKQHDTLQAMTSLENEQLSLAHMRAQLEQGEHAIWEAKQSSLRQKGKLWLAIGIVAITIIAYCIGLVMFKRYHIRKLKEAHSKAEHIMQQLVRPGDQP